MQHFNTVALGEAPVELQIKSGDPPVRLVLKKEGHADALTVAELHWLAVLQGAAIALLYALGLGAPMIALAAYLSKHDALRLPALLRGRNWSFKLGATDLALRSRPASWPASAAGRCSCR